VGETADIGDLLGLNPLALFGNGSGAMVSALTDGAHMLYFCTINHGKIPFFSKTGLPPFIIQICENSHIPELLYWNLEKKSIVCKNEMHVFCAYGQSKTIIGKGGSLGYELSCKQEH
jgi:hypothetical protein